MCCGEAEAELAARNSIQRQVESGICVSLLSVLLSGGDEVSCRYNIIGEGAQRILSLGVFSLLTIVGCSGE